MGNACQDEMVEEMRKGNDEFMLYALRCVFDTVYSSIPYTSKR